MNKWRTIILITMLIFFGTGLINLLLMRFEAGDVYPAYSSLRSDPLGAKAFYKALSGLAPLTVSRHFQPPVKALPDAQSVLLLIGLSSATLNENDPDFLDLIQRLKQEGGRLILAFYPRGPKPAVKDKNKEPDQKSLTERASPSAEKEAGPGQNRKDIRQGKILINEKPPAITLAEYLGIAMDYSARRAGKAETITAVQVETPQPDESPVCLPAAAGLPRRLAWHSSLVFKTIHSGWQPRYATREGAVILARNFGKGEVVLVGDSYLFSNEAMRSGRQSRLLAWLIGEKTRIVFSESHLGISQSIGVADLMIRYRLYGLLPALVLLSMLIIWKNSTAFVPLQRSRSKQNSNEYTSTRDYTQGVISLLRRHIAPKDILAAGFQEWQKSAGAGRRIPPEKRERVKNLMTEASAQTGRKKDPAGTYCAVSNILSERKQT